MRQLFPHYMVFLAALASAALVAMILVYVFIPAKQDGVLPSSRL